MHFKILGTLLIYIEIVKLNLAESYDLVILPNIPILEKEYGSNVFLTCKLNNSSVDIRILWFDNVDNEITADQGVSDSSVWVSYEGGETHLFISSLSSQLTGNYTCKVKVNNDIKKQLYKEVRVIETSKFKDVPLEQILGRGRDGLVICEPADEVTVAVRWRKDDVIISGDGEKYVMNRTGLIIKNVDIVDSGKYTCDLQISSSYDMIEIQVIIHEPLSVTKEIGNIIGIEGADFSLSCEASGGGTLEYQFYFNGVLLINSSRTIVNLENGQLFFSPLSRCDDGIYTCFIYSTALETVKSNGKLTVQIPPSILSFPNISVEENQSISIACLFEGIPTPSVVITKTGCSLRIEENILRISRLDLSDHGTYVCEVHSELGRDLKEAEINVLFKPRATSDQIYEWFNFAHHTKNITCSVIANPPPSFAWFYNDVELTTSNSTFMIFHGVYESQLQMYIETNDQYWIYTNNYKSPAKITCSATNSIGGIDIDMSLQRATISDTLYNLTYIAYPCQIDFNYSLPEDTGGEPVTGFVAYLNETPRELPFKKMIRINKLEASTHYKVKLACVTVVGYGDYVDEFEITTTLPSKPYPVELLSAVNTSVIAECTTDVIEPSDCSVCVKWDEPIDVCIPVQNYRIRHRLVAHDPNTGITSPIEDWVTRSDYNGAELSITLKCLRCNSSYEFEMFAKNDLGESKSSGMLFFRTYYSKEVEDLEDDKIESGWNLALILIIIFSVIAFLIIVDLSCYFTKEWGLFNYLKNLSFSNNNLFGNKFSQSQKLHAEIKFDTKSLQYQERFAALTPTEAPSDYQQILFSASISQITTSSNEIDTFHEDERYTED